MDSESDPSGWRTKAGRFSLTLLQYSFLVFTGKPDVKMRSPMGMHKFKALDLKFRTSKCMCSFCDVRKLENPSFATAIVYRPGPHPHPTLQPANVGDSL